MKTLLKYIKPFRMDDGDKAYLTLGKSYEVKFHEKPMVSIVNDKNNKHYFDLPGYGWFKTEDYFEVITEDK